MAIKVGHQVAVNIGFGFNHHGYITSIDNALEAVQVTLETSEIHVVPWTMVKARRGRPRTPRGYGQGPERASTDSQGLQSAMPAKRVDPLILSTRHLDNGSMAEMVFEIRANFDPSDAEEMIKRYCR